VKVRLLFDQQRIAYAMEARMRSELKAHKVNSLQMWLLLLMLGGWQQDGSRVGKPGSANNAAVELCVLRTRAANEFTRLSKRTLIKAVALKKGADKRNRRFGLTDEGEQLARKLRALLSSIEKEMLESVGCRATDRAIEPQCLLMGLWVTGNPQTRLPTLTRLVNLPQTLTAGDKRGVDVIRLKRPVLPSH
jgi:DNA-binding MarR family transcriptional regulator